MIKVKKEHRDPLLQELEELFFQKLGKSVVFRTRLSRYDEGSVYVYEKMEGIWVEDSLEEIELILAECCDKLEIKGDTRKKLVACFMKQHSRNFEDFNVDGEKYFVITEGVIDLFVLRGKKYKSVTELMLHRDEWLHPFTEFKDNYFTTKSPITIPEDFDEECVKAVEFFISTYTKSMCGRRDYAETLMDHISLIVYGKSKSHFFYHLFGVSKTGKTHLMELLKLILGDSYFYRIPIDVFKKKDVNTRTALYMNQFARCINVSEIENLPDSLDQLKTILGENAVPYEFADFYLNATIFIDNNELYNFTSKAALNREVLLPFGFVDDNLERDSMLLDKLTLIAPYLFLEMLRRFSNLDVDNLTIPESTTEIRTVYKQMLKPEEKFRDVFVTTNAHGRAYHTDVIFHRFFLKEFDLWFKNWVYSYPWARNLELPKTTDIKIVDFEKCFQDRFHNWTKYSNSHKYACFQNLEIGNPGSYGTMRNRHKQDLILSLQITDQEAEEIITLEEGVSQTEILENQYEDDYRDVLGNITPEQWKYNILYQLYTAFCMNDFGAIIRFKQSFSDYIQSLEQSNQLFSVLQNGFMKYHFNFKACYHDINVSNAINKLFEYFVRWRRADLKARKGISPTDPRIALSPLFPVIPTGTFQNASVLPESAIYYQQPQLLQNQFNYNNQF